MTNPARMFTVTEATKYDLEGMYLKTNEFNALYVVRYWIKLPTRSSKDWLRRQISRYKIRNFFRTITGRPLLKPRCVYRHCNPPYLTVEFTGGNKCTFRFASNAHAQRGFDSLDRFMKSPY